MKSGWGPLAAVCALVIGVYACMAQSGVVELLSPNAAGTYYNLLVDGFRVGQLSLKKDVPPGLTRLADPYNPVANGKYQAPPYRLLDLSYYRGRLYLYFGVTPALILFWPYVALTGHYLFHRQAVAIFCSVGFLSSLVLLRALWRRYYVGVSVGVLTACALALGLATAVPVLLSQSDVYEVPISCGYMLTMLALGAIWCALHEPERRCRWLAVASLVYGLALGARPSLLFGASILLVPVAQARREGPPMGARLLAAMGPIMFIGFGLMLYNSLRFGSPFEFGIHYQLAGERQVTRQLFNLRYLWFNFRVYFLEPARWSARSPFVLGTAALPMPAGYAKVGSFGVLTNIPLTWLALAAPLAWRNPSGQAEPLLRWFVIAVALLFGTCAAPLLLFESAILRYDVDFLPTLVLLATIGIFGLERALADRPVWRRTARWAWGGLAVLSVAFNLLATVERYAEAHNTLGNNLLLAGKVSEAIGEYETAVRMSPDYAVAHFDLGHALELADRPLDAIRHYEQAVWIQPDFTDAQVSLGVILARTGRVKEAMGHWEQALRVKPDQAEAHFNLGLALAGLGRTQEAIGHYEAVLRIKPDDAEAHNNLGLALVQAGRVQDAIEHWERALRINPDCAEAHYNLGVALEQVGRPQDALGHYGRAFQIQPDFTEARTALARLLSYRDGQDRHPSGNANSPSKP